MARFEDAWSSARGIQSAVTEAECRALFEEADRAPARVVEIGSYLGRSTVVLSRAVGVRGRVIAFDPFSGSRGVGGSSFPPILAVRLLENLKDRSCFNVDFYQMTSAEGARSWALPGVSLLWIDGDHTYKGVRGDWNCWLEHLDDRARVVLHDKQFDGPARLIEEVQSEGWKVVRSVEKLVVLERA